MTKAKKGNTKEEPIEKQLWKTADKLRKNIGASVIHVEQIATFGDKSSSPQ